MFSSGEVRWYQRSLCGRDLIRRRGAKLGERFRQFAESVAVRLYGIGERTRVCDNRILMRGKILLRPFLRELRHVQEDQSQRKQPPAARFAHQPKIGLFSIHYVHRNERQVLVHSRRAEPEFHRGFWRPAKQHDVIVVVGGKQRLTGAVRQRKPLHQCAALCFGQRAECGAIIARQIIRKFGLVRAAGSGQHVRQRSSWIFSGSRRAASALLERCEWWSRAPRRRASGARTREASRNKTICAAPQKFFLHHD